MPELPDITIYVERLRALVAGQPLERLEIASPFVLRTVEPRPDAFRGQVVAGMGRLGKRIVLEFGHTSSAAAGDSNGGTLFAVIHLMIAGRLHWRPPGTMVTGKGTPKKQSLVAFGFPNGTLVLTEAGSKRRASLHLVAGRAGLEALRRGGIDVFEASPEEFGAALRAQNRTLKRALTDPDVVDGIGNAYSDEILHRARLSPFKLTGSLTPNEVASLQRGAVAVLTEWIDRLRDEVAATASGFPEKVTAFHPEMAVHGKYGKPCPVCGAPVQRIVYAENEANYCPGCQTGGNILADRVLSRLLHDDWPRTLEELEQMRPRR